MGYQHDEGNKLPRPFWLGATIDFVTLPCHSVLLLASNLVVGVIVECVLELAANDRGDKDELFATRNEEVVWSQAYRIN